MTFGLIAVDRETQKRTAKPSLAYLGKAVKGNLDQQEDQEQEKQ